MTTDAITIRTTAWQKALGILKKPLAAPAPQTNDAASKGRKGTPSWEQLQAEVEDALRDMSRERHAAESLIATVGERREALLMEPGSDDLLLSLGAECELAQITLERLDRVQPELVQRWGEIKFHARNARWAKVRDEYAPQFERFLEIEQAYLRARDEWWAVHQACRAAFPEKDVTPILPRMAALVCDGRVLMQDGFETFRVSEIILDRGQRPMFMSQASFIEVAKMNGEVHPETPLEWREICEQHLLPVISVELSTSYTTTDGELHSKGEIIQLPPEEAHAMVRRGRAILRT